MTHITIDRLPTNTSDRLRLVAEVIERNPSQWDQGTWISDPNERLWSFDQNSLHRAAGRTNVCGTTACQAGWLVTFTPDLPSTFDWWPEAAAFAGGLEPDLAEVMFHEDFGSDSEAADIAAFLRELAEIPEGERTLANAKARISDFAALAEWVDEDDAVDVE